MLPTSILKPLMLHFYTQSNLITIGHGKHWVSTLQEEYTIPEVNIISPDFNGNQHQTSKRQEIETTLSYLSSNLKTIFGYRYRYINGVENDSALFIDDFMLEDVLDKLMPYKTHELFAQVNYRIDDNWDVETGVRYSRLPEVFEGTRFYLKLMIFYIE